MDYQKWAAEYAAEAESLRQRVARLREELKTEIKRLKLEEIRSRADVQDWLKMHAREAGMTPDALFEHLAFLAERDRQALEEFLKKLERFDRTPPLHLLHATAHH